MTVRRGGDLQFTTIAQATGYKIRSSRAWGPILIRGPAVEDATSMQPGQKRGSGPRRRIAPGTNRRRSRGSRRVLYAHARNIINSTK